MRKFVVLATLAVGLLWVGGSAYASPIEDTIDIGVCSYGCDNFQSDMTMSTLFRADDELSAKTVAQPLSLEPTARVITPNVVVPEPASLMLLGVGLFGASLVNRLRRRS